MVMSQKTCEIVMSHGHFLEFRILNLRKPIQSSFRSFPPAFYTSAFALRNDSFGSKWTKYTSTSRQISSPRIEMSHCPIANPVFMFALLCSNHSVQHAKMRISDTFCFILDTFSERFQNLLSWSFSFFVIVILCLNNLHILS